MLTVSNSYTEGKNVDISRFFERFYRQDESHNSGKSGFGIGLSMGKEIAERTRENSTWAISTKILVLLEKNKICINCFIFHGK